MSGLRAELALPDLERCPVAAASAETEEPITSITWASEQDDTVVEEFSTDGDIDPETIDGSAQSVFEYQTETVYQFERQASPCLCGFVEQQSHPIRDVTAEDGTLVVTLHVDSRDALRDLIREIRDRFGPVHLRSLLDAEGETVESDVVQVDRSRLTDRQREVLTVASEMGYFASPREANATAVASELGIDVSTFTEHLAAAQSRLMDDILET